MAENVPATSTDTHRAPQSAISAQQSAIAPWLPSLPIAWKKRSPSHAIGRRPSGLTTSSRSSATSAQARRTLSKVCSRVLKARKKQPVPPSPCVHEYRCGRLPVFHFDFYRLTARSEIDEIGFDEYLEEGGITVIEWADRFPQVLPARTRWLRLETSAETERVITEEREMKVLALELSSPVGSVAFCDDRGKERGADFPGRPEGLPIILRKSARGISRRRATRSHRGRAGSRLLCGSADRDCHRARPAPRIRRAPVRPSFDLCD